MERAILAQRFDRACDDLRMIVETKIRASHEVNDMAAIFLAERHNASRQWASIDRHQSLKMRRIEVTLSILNEAAGVSVGAVACNAFLPWRFGFHLVLPMGLDSHVSGALNLQIKNSIK
ncbi:hypothetical protein EFR01_10520 [Sinorhizobium fredii]|nr:hypothetical protein EFR01_10520 [Sinorhizobium fredii]GLS10432.1 hypothetical protein GCM10007864_40630 [Sinorhizobium fredii]